MSNLNRVFPQYMLFGYDNGYYTLQTGWGLFPEYEELIEIIKGLQKFADDYKDEIHNHNVKVSNEMFNVSHRPNNKEKKEKDLKCVYLMKSENYYKIGISKNVNRRCKELATTKMPYEIKIIAQTCLISNADDIEKKLHERFKKQRINGEWFLLDDKQVQQVLDIFNYIKEEYDKWVEKNAG